MRATCTGVVAFVLTQPTKQTSIDKNDVERTKIGTPLGRRRWRQWRRYK